MSGPRDRHGRPLGDYLPFDVSPERSRRHADLVEVKLGRRKRRRRAVRIAGLGLLLSGGALASWSLLHPGPPAAPAIPGTGRGGVAPAAPVVRTGTPMRGSGDAAGADPAAGGADDRAASASDAPTEVAARRADEVADALGVGLAFGGPDTPYQNHARVHTLLRDLGVRHVADHVEDGDPDEVPPLLATGADVLAILDSSAAVDSTARRLGPTLFAVTIQDAPAQTRDEAWARAVRREAEALRDARDRTKTPQRPTIVAPNVGLEHGLLVGDLSPWVDFGRVQYGLDGDPPGHPKIEAALAVAARLFRGRPLVAMVGYSTARHQLGVTEQVQAKYLPRLLLELVGRGVSRVYLRHLLDIYSTDETIAGNYGLVRYDGTKKPAFQALADLLATTADPGPAFRPDALAIALPEATSPVHHLLLARRDGSHVLALWLEIPSGDEEITERVTLKLGTAVAIVRVLRPGAGLVSTSLPVRPDGSFTIDVRDSVALVEIPTAPAPPVP